MVMKKRNWWEKQKTNELHRITTWYWFVDYQNNSSLTTLILPKYTLRKFIVKRKIKKPHYYVFSHHTTPSGYKNGYLDTTPLNFFSKPIKMKNLNDYKLRYTQLNLKFLWEYLKKKEINLNSDEKEILSKLLNNPKVRLFLFNWNKFESRYTFKNAESRLKYLDETDYWKIGGTDIIYRTKKENGETTITIPSYDFRRTLTEAIITFLRQLSLAGDNEVMMRYAFSKESSKEYFKIIDVIEEIDKPLTKSRNHFDNALYKINSKYIEEPILIGQVSVWKENDKPKDEIEKQILDYLHIRY